MIRSYGAIEVVATWKRNGILPLRISSHACAPIALHTYGSSSLHLYRIAASMHACIHCGSLFFAYIHTHIHTFAASNGPHLAPLEGFGGESGLVGNEVNRRVFSSAYKLGNEVDSSRLRLLTEGERATIWLVV